MKLNISDIQHFSLGDGDGIRTTVFFKGCNMRCPWCHNPETVSPKPQILRFPAAGTEKLCGVEMSVDEILANVMQDAEFYAASGGGVTLSGGEAMLQADGAAALAKELRSRNVHVIMDTAGCVPYAAFEKTNGTISQYFYDFKACTAADYARLGGDYRQVYDNLCRLLQDGKSVRVRIPLIPDFNTARDYVEKMCDCLQKAETTEVDLLPFHRLGAGKYRALRLSYAYARTEPLSLARAEEIAKIYGTCFKVKIER